MFGCFMKYNHKTASEMVMPAVYWYFNNPVTIVRLCIHLFQTLSESGDNAYWAYPVIQATDSVHMHLTNKHTEQQILSPQSSTSDEMINCWKIEEIVDKINGQQNIRMTDTITDTIRMDFGCCDKFVCKILQK